MSGRVRLEWTVHIDIYCLDNSMVAEGVYDGLCLYKDT